MKSSKSLIGLSIILSLWLATPSSAQVSAASATSDGANSESTSKSSLGKILGNKKFEESETLTDPKLRVEDGSLSHYSVSSTLGYNGPPVGSLSTADQPNPDHKIGPYAQKLTGNIMGKYRLDPVQSLSVGTGVAFNHPFSGWDRTDVNNPFIRYDLASRIGGWQMRNSPELLYSTIPNYTAVGEIGGFEWYNALVHNLGTSRFAFELDTFFFAWIFDRGYQGADGSVQAWSIMTSPIIKYQYSDRLNFNAGVTLSGWNPRARNDSTILLGYIPTGSVGLVYAYNRDIYFAPCIGLFPGQFAWNTTTVNFTTVISLL